tara:strand:+ start:321 stop:1187 length:867 start_codon:yes stop_codon:yes gene_type:complete
MEASNKSINLLMLFAMLTWGMAWSSAKIINQFLGYDELVFLRFLVSLIIMIPFIFNKPIKLKFIEKDIIINMLIVSILFFLYNQCFFKGTDLGQAGKAGVFVTTTNPIITFIIISIIEKKIHIFQTFAVFLGLIGGLFILDIFNQEASNLLNSGTIYFISCSIIWGIMTVLMSFKKNRINPFWYITICYFLTSLISIFFIDVKSLSNFNYLDSIFLIHFSIVASAMSIGTSIYIYASSSLGAIKVSSFIFLVPFIAMSTAYLVMDEPMSWNIIIGGSLSMLSVYFINK